ncbi:hypothetical protein B0T13DRAFT_134105 [Neurospora crassa]|nr:hypothetical protein B0T13DRAFT_134105 [Neurospora crassa]
MTFRPSSRTSASSTSSGSSIRTCREKRLPDSAAVGALVYFCGRNPRKVKAVRVYETTYLDNDTSDDLDCEMRSSVSSSKRSRRSGPSWVSSDSNCGRVKQEFYFVESRTGGYGSGAGYKGGEQQQQQQQPAQVAAARQWKPPKSGSEREFHSSKRSSKSGGSHKHSHGHGHRGRQGPPSATSEEEDEGKYDEEETDDGSRSVFNEFNYQGGGPGGPGASASPFPLGPPGMVPPPPTSCPPNGGLPGYHQQQPMYNMGGPPPPMPPMTPHGHRSFHHHPNILTAGTRPPMMSGSDGGRRGRGGHFQQDRNGI